MAMNLLPDYRKKQLLLYTEHKSVGELIAYGDGYLEAGRIADALEFYQKANHTAGLEAIRDRSQRMGDVMLFMQASKVLGQAPSPEDWLAVGQAAWKVKKYSFALLAFEKGGHDKLLQETEEIVRREVIEVSR